MFSNKGNQEGNTNKNSSGSNHAAGDDNTIKNKNNNIHTNNSNFNHSNNTYNISHNYNGNTDNKRKNIIKSIFPSKKNSNTHNIIIGWASILVNIVLIIVTIVSIINTFKASESSRYSPNSLGTSQTPSTALSASTTPASPSISATYSASSLPSVQTTSPYPSGSQSVSSPAITPSTTPSTRSGYIEFELSTRYISGGEYLGKDNDYPDSDVAEYSKTGDKIKIGYIWKVKDSSGTSKYGENCSIDFNLYEKDNPQSIDHIKNPQCDSSSVFNISKKGHYIIKAVDSKSSVEGTVEFTIR